MTQRPPQAKVLGVHDRTVRIQCPYCGREHAHTIWVFGRQWRAPRCGMYRSADQRATGYTFTATKHKPREGSGK